MNTGRLFTPHILIGSNLINFIRVVFRLNFSIKRTSFLRLVITFFILLVLTPFRIIESVIYFFTKKEEVRQPIFIIGHPRSGTTFFHDTLNELDDMVAPRTIDCLFPFLNKHFKFLLIPILKKALPETRLMDKMKVNWDSPQEEEFGMALMNSSSSVSFLFAPLANNNIIKDNILLENSMTKAKWLATHLKFARKIQTINKGKTLIFKSPGNTARVSELLEIYPDAKFIHIVRSPQNVIPSTIHLYKSILPEFSLQNESALEIKGYVFEYYFRVMNKFITSKVEISENQLYEFKYEDFTQNPLVVLKDIFDKLRINSNPDVLFDFFESRKNFKKNRYNQDPELEKEIRQQCSIVAERYGYS